MRCRHLLVASVLATALALGACSSSTTSTPAGATAGVGTSPPGPGGVNEPDAGGLVPEGGDDAADGGDVLPPGPRTSISQFTTCDGVTDDWQGATTAFAAAKGGAFTLIVDCPVKIHTGLDVERPIFVEDDTAVAFTGAGKFILDNLFAPAFVFADTTKVTLLGWNVEWDGSMPVNPNTGGYYKGGVFVPGTGNGAGVFNDSVLTPWLASHRGVVFEGGVKSVWAGPVNMSALFLVTGDTSALTVKRMRLYAPPAAGVERFIPFAFAFTGNYKKNQTVSRQTPVTAQYREVPHGLVFSDVTVDGAYMVFQGTVHDALFEHVRSERYGDLQDASNGNVGGMGKWFPPPHLFYLNYDTAATADPALVNRNIVIRDVIDNGVRLGIARDKGGTDTLSGYALSLKLGCVACSVDGYTTFRPDGFMDVLSSDGLTVSNVTASYDSTFLNGVFPGWRWPQSPYKNVTFTNMTLIDTAKTAAHAPIGNGQGSGIVFKNVIVTVNDAPTASLVPSIGEQGASSELDFVVNASATRIAAAQSLTAGFTLEASPATLKAGAATTLTWKSATGGCAAAGGAGGWSGALAASGTITVTLPAAGTVPFTLSCKNAVDTASATLPVVVTP